MASGKVIQNTSMTGDKNNKRELLMENN